MKTIFQVVGWAWVVFCIIVDVLVYRRSRSWRVRSIPALIKLLCSVLLVLIHFLLPNPPMLEPDVATLPMFAILVCIGVLIDIWAWLFCDGYPSKRKTRIYAWGIAIAMAFLLVCGFLFDGNFYHHSSSGWMEHFTFNDYTGQCSETLNLYEAEPECRFTFDAEEGKLELLVTDEAGQVLYSGVPEDPSEFTVTSVGPIRITITTEAFTGKLYADRVDPDDPQWTQD